LGILSNIRRLLYYYKNVLNDTNRMYRFYSLNENDERKLANSIRLCVHSIEKGMSLQDTRPRFGIKKIDELIKLLEQYKNKKCSYDSMAYNLGIDVLKTYIDYHNDLSIDVKDIYLKAKYLLDENSYENKTGVYTFTKKAIYENISDFKLFANSRHSVRMFGADNVDDDKIKNSIILAQSAPSACNRQPNKVYWITEQNLLKELIQYQGGTKGLSNIKGILVVTSNLYCYNSPAEKTTPYVDGGIYYMNLLYALHYNEIATCPLIWHSKPKSVQWSYKTLGIPENEIIIATIAYGSYPHEQFKVAKSYRRGFNEVLIKKS